ncbi:protein kinase domain-containing protein [Streptomyces viridochromogenes]|uniref:protein kinase domain-containing protein n=1 Tax=Streptomyces viridochromogenes TaxID=1938 RepID=UPI00069DD9BD|nr:protein kinase [Streptomyces viridochromogenes]
MDRWKWRRGKKTPEPAGRVDPRRTVAASYPVPDADGAAPDGSADDASAVWSPGDTVAGLYEVRAVLGQGMMGVVHRVRHLAWDTDLAVKTPLPDVLVSQADKERFVREAETWVSLGLHPHVCNCYYVRTLGGVPRVFTEYLYGGSLRDWIDDRRLYRGSSRKVLARVLDIAIQMAWGLEHSHRHGVVHQDVKPANVILDTEGTARVTDFGLARTGRGGAVPWPAVPGPGAPASQASTLLVTVGGLTPAYASPEQVAGEALDRRTDVWSFAVTVLEMFLGEITWFAGPDAAAKLAEHRRRGRAGGGLPDLPDRLAELLAHCLLEDPADRPRDMSEIVARLFFVYSMELGRPYPRPAPKEVQLRADELNNRGLSLLDLGRFEEAEAAFAEALATDPRHLEATYDSGLLRWRAGRLTDDALVHGIEGAPARPGASSRAKQQLLAQVHLERGSLAEALPLLEEAARAEPENTEIRTALLHARAEGLATGRPLHTFRHAAPVTADLSADGRLAVTGDPEGTIRLWDVDANRILVGFRAHETDVHSICLSDDGLLILSAGMDYSNQNWPYTVRLWDTQTGECVWEHATDTGVQSVRLSPGSRLLLFGSHDSTVRVWDADGRWGALGQPLSRFTLGTFPVWPSPDGRAALSGFGSKPQLWDVETGACLRTFEGHAQSVVAVCMSADGSMAVSGGTDNTVRLWDVATGRCLRVLQGHTGSVRSVRISDDARTVVSGGADNAVRLWDVATGRCLRTFEGHTGAVNAIGLTGDGRRVLSAGADGEVRLWQLQGDSRYVCPLRPSRPRSHAELAQLDLRVEALLDAAERHLSKGRTVAARVRLEKVRSLPRHDRYPRALAAWHTLALSSVRVGARAVWQSGSLEGHTGNVHTVSVSADGRLVLSGSWDETVRLWEAPTGRCLRVFEGPNGLRSSCLSGDGRLALIRTEDGVVQLWETESGRVLQRLETPPGRVGTVCMGGGDRLALIGGSGGESATTTVWDLETGRVLHTLEGEMRGGRGWLSTDGRLALTSGRSRTLQAWDLESGLSLPKRKLKYLGSVGAVSLSADGRSVLVGGADRGLALWNLATGQSGPSFKGHTGEVYSVCLSSDGRFALSGSWDSTLRLWDVESGRCLHVLKGHTGEVSSAVLSADGRFAVSAGGDSTVRLWEIDWELDARRPADWDEAARPHLEAFLTLHTPPYEDGSTYRRGTPTWSEEDFDGLYRTLQYAGLGWLRPSGVRAELSRMASDWWEPPPL